MAKRTVIYWTDKLNPPRQLDITDFIRMSVPPILPPDNVEVTVNFDAIVLFWEEVGRADGYNVYIDGERANEETIPDTIFTIPRLRNGFYDIEISSVQGALESELFYAGEFEIKATPENLLFLADTPSTGTLSWDPVDDVEGYNVYLNGELFNEALITTSSVLLENLDVGEYQAYVTSVFFYLGDDITTESFPSDAVLFAFLPPIETTYMLESSTSPQTQQGPAAAEANYELTGLNEYEKSIE
jgi:hypothetical protein